MRASGRLLAIGDYRRTWAIGAAGGVARWLEFVALAIATYELTRSPELVAMLGLLRMAPYMVLGVPMGALADAIDRRVMLIASLAVMVVLSALLAGVAMAGALTYPWIAAAMLAGGVFWTTDMPVRRRLMVDAASGHDIAAALGLDNASMYASRAIGPLVGGATYQLVGATGIFVLVGVIYLYCLVMALRVEARAVPQPASTLPLLARLVPPVSLLMQRRFLIVMGVTVVFNLWCFPFVTMVPVIAQKEFLMSPAAVGAFAALEGIGGTLGALAIGALASERTLFRFYYWGTAGFLAALLVVAANLSALPTGLMLPLIGVASAAFSATQYAIVHVSVPAEMRGRAAGVLAVFIGTSIVGHYWTGVMFERDGTVAAVWTMGVYGLAAMAVLGLAWLIPVKESGGELSPRP